MMETPRRAEAAMTSSVPKTGKKSLRNVVELTPENFKDYISADAKKPTSNVFVEFYAPWCPYCKRLEPIWNELPSKLEEAGSKTRVARMNVDTYTEYASAYAVTGFPTLMLFENGRPVGAKTGLVDMKMAMRYAGVQDEGILAQFTPEKKLDKVLSGAQIEYVQGQVGAVREELAGIKDVDSRARALEALQQIESIVGVRTL
jgi:thioredoxin-like negative regulator of GroEL